MGLEPNWYQIGDRTYYIPNVTKFYIYIKSTDLKVSSLACKCVFYRTKQNTKWGLNFEGLEMQK